MRFSRKACIPVGLIFVAALCLRGEKPVYVPPPFPDPDPFDFPLDPPDPFTDPFDPINDLPLPELPDFPPEFPGDPFDDPLPLPDFPDLDDPFPDFPSLMDGLPLEVPTSSSMTPKNEPPYERAAANVYTPLLPFPMRLLFPPSRLPAGGGQANQMAPATRRVCDAATASKLLVPESKKNTVAFLDTCPFRVTSRVVVGNNPVSATGTPDGQFALIPNAGSGSVSIVDLASRTAVTTIPIPALDGVPSQPNKIAVLPDGSRAYVTDHLDNPGSAVFIIDLTTRAITGMIRVDGFPASIAATPDGSQVWVTSRAEGTVTIIDTLTSAIVYRASVPLATGIAFNPTGTTAYVAAGNPGGGYIQVFDASTYQGIAQIPVGRLPHVVAVTPTGRHIFVTNALSNSITQIDAATNLVVRTIQLHGQHPLGLAFVR